MARLVCDDPGVVAQPDHYMVLGLTTEPLRVDPDPSEDYGFALDLGFLDPGTYTAKAQACDTNWGCSIDSDPLEFTKPETLSPPTGLRLLF